MIAADDLAARIRTLLASVPRLEERRMFGGLAFIVNGNMCCGVVRNRLVLRLGEEGAGRALARPHAAPMDFTGRPLGSMVFVDAGGCTEDADLRAWIDQALAFVQTLPAKR